MQPRPQDVKLGLAHHAAEPEQHPIVGVGRVVHAVGVGQENLEDRAQFEQMVPVLARPGQPAHLPAEDDADVAERDLGEQTLEPEPPLDRLPAHRLVVVDDQDPGLGPPELDGAAAELVLQVGRLAVARGPAAGSIGGRRRRPGGRGGAAGSCARTGPGDQCGS